tara:strand:+ start:199 stop:546 length:348 start_codon:yes stop_codon:yes gene_type:complete
MNANKKTSPMRGTQYAKDISERTPESLSQPKKKKYPIASGPSSGYPPNAFLDQDQLTELIRFGSMRVSPRMLLTIDENNKLHLKDTASDDLVSAILQDLAKSGIDTTKGVTRGQR